jgi:hypothetical protein
MYKIVAVSSSILDLSKADVVGYQKTEDGWKAKEVTVQTYYITTVYTNYEEDGTIQKASSVVRTDKDGNKTEFTNYAKEGEKETADRLKTSWSDGAITSQEPYCSEPPDEEIDYTLLSAESGTIQQHAPLPETTTPPKPFTLESFSQEPGKYKHPGIEFLNTIESTRNFCLAQIKEGKTLPSRDPIVSKEFPPSTAWFSGVTESTPKILTKIIELSQKHAIKLIKYNSSLSSWVQDYIEFSKEIRMPANLKKTRTEFADMIYQTRQVDAPTLYKSGTEVKMIGVVNELYQMNYYDAAFLAKKWGVPISMNITYNEGGNTISGVDEQGKPYVIIGRDAYRLSKEVLKLSDTQVREAFAYDYGVPIENVFIVEQPGTFHLDVAMCIASSAKHPKTILLNDAVTAWEVIESQLPEPLHPKVALIYREAARRQKTFEDQTEHDLVSQGFTVFRVPGAFENPKSKERMNFFNMVQGTTANGEKYIITLGCQSPVFEELFKAHLKKAGCECTDITFLDYDESKGLLQLDGGISCQLKTFYQRIYYV